MSGTHKNRQPAGGRDDSATNESTMDAADAAIAEALGTGKPGESSSEKREAAAPAAAGPARAEQPTPPQAAELVQRTRERDEYLDLLQRTRADFANYQKRVQKQVELDRQFATQALLRDLLPVLDNLERALQSAPANTPAGGVVAGIKMVQQNLLATLGRHGVSAIESDGRPFDPNVHEAINHQPSADHPPDTVLMTLERGYRIHDRVLRPSKVIVSSTAQLAPTGEPKKG